MSVPTEGDQDSILKTPRTDSKTDSARSKPIQKQQKPATGINPMGRSKSEVASNSKYPRRNLGNVPRARTDFSSGSEVDLKSLMHSKNRNNKSKSRFEAARLSDSESHLSELTITKSGEKKSNSKSTRMGKIRNRLPTLGKKNPRKRGGKVKSAASAGSSFSKNRSRAFSKPIRDSLADVSFSMTKNKSMLPDQNEINIEANSRMSRALRKHLGQIKEGEISFGVIPFDDFDCFKRNMKDMAKFFNPAFLKLELSVLYNDDRTLMYRFLNKVLTKYKPREEVAFHSFYHGFSVAQMAVYFVMKSRALQELFDKKTLYTFIISALCHDIDHPGTSNYYEVASQSKNAKKFENISVLESHHTITTLELLKARDGELNVFKYLDTDSQERMSELLVEFILATDMSKHGEHLEFLKKLKDLDIGDEDEDYETKLNLLKAVIHACDLSGQCFSKELAFTWEENIHFEMLNEFQRLKKHKLEVPKHLQHLEANDEVLKQRFKSQTGFIKFFLLPYWVEIARLFPQVQGFCDNLKENLSHFEKGSK